MTEQKPVALILAAGSGTRFIGSGGVGFKQLTPYRGEPIILRLVRQIEECAAFGEIIIVLGANEECRSAIMYVLRNKTVKFIINSEADRDNNLISFYKGICELQRPTLLIEADCVVETDDLIAMVDGLEQEEIRWAEIGDANEFEYGGVVELDPNTGLGIGVDVLTREEFLEFNKDGRMGVKMFGLSAFGINALSIYREEISKISNPYKKYFHHVATQTPDKFLLTTYRVSEGCFSFNTIAEFKSEDE